MSESGMEGRGRGKRSFDELASVSTHSTQHEGERSPDTSPRRRIRWAEGDVTDVRCFKADACKAPVPPTMLLISEVLRAKHREEAEVQRQMMLAKQRNIRACLANITPLQPVSQRFQAAPGTGDDRQAKRAALAERLRAGMVKYLEKHLRTLAAQDNISAHNVEKNVPLAAAFVERTRHRLSRTWEEYCDVEAHCALARMFHEGVHWWLGCGSNKDGGLFVTDRPEGAQGHSMDALEEEVEKKQQEQRQLQMILFQQQQKQLLTKKVALHWHNTTVQHSADSISNVSIPLVPALE